MLLIKSKEHHFEFHQLFVISLWRNSVESSRIYTLLEAERLGQSSKSAIRKTPTRKSLVLKLWLHYSQCGRSTTFLEVPKFEFRLLFDWVCIWMRSQPSGSNLELLRQSQPKCFRNFEVFQPAMIVRRSSEVGNGETVWEQLFAFSS